MKTNEILEKLTLELDKKKAIDIKVMDISQISDVADFFFICSANNPNQLKTLVDTAEFTLDQCKVDYHTEGRSDSGWVLIDCIDIIIHVFSNDEREFYNLEHMWADGDFVDIEKFLPKRENKE